MKKILAIKRKRATETLREFMAEQLTEDVIEEINDMLDYTDYYDLDTLLSEMIEEQPEQS